MQRESCRAKLQRQKKERESTLTKKKERDAEGHKSQCRATTQCAHAEPTQSDAVQRRDCAERHTDRRRGSQRLFRVSRRVQKLCLWCFMIISASLFLVKIYLLKNNNKTLIYCTGFPSLSFSGDNCPKISVYM